MKVVIHYWDGSSYTYTGYTVNSNSVSWMFDTAYLTSPQKNFRISLEEVKYLEITNTEAGEHSVYYRPTANNFKRLREGSFEEVRKNLSKNLSVKVDVMSARQRIRSNKRDRPILVGHVDVGVSQKEKCDLEKWLLSNWTRCTNSEY